MRPLQRHWSYDLRTHETRKATNKVLEMVDEGMLNPRDILVMALRWMSEDDVKAMCEANEINLEEEQEDDI